MAVAIVLDFAGGTLDQYDQVCARMGLTPGGPGPAGALGHWVMATDDGIRVTDVWQTREQFDTFAAEQIGPLTAELGMAPPETTFYEVHNYFTAG